MREGLVPRKITRPSCEFSNVCCQRVQDRSLEQFCAANPAMTHVSIATHISRTQSPRPQDDRKVRAGDEPVTVDVRWWVHADRTPEG